MKRKKLRLSSAPITSVDAFLRDIGARPEDRLWLSDPHHEGERLVITVDQPDKPCQHCRTLR